MELTTIEVNFWVLLGGISVLIALFLFMILYLRWQAFIGLLIIAIVAGLMLGMPVQSLIHSIKSGIGNPGMGGLILVIGLGGIFGAILEKTGGAHIIAQTMINKMGVKLAPLALLIAGFIIAIPVFFDVAFIILVPVVYALQKKTGKSLLLYAIPLLSGLAITHTFIPPTPGPILVADALGVELGWVIFTGFMIGMPTALISGLWFGKFISKKVKISNVQEHELTDANIYGVTFKEVLVIIFVPILLIVTKTVYQAVGWKTKQGVEEAINLLGEPLIALILANLLAWYFLGIKKGLKKRELLSVSTKSLGTVGAIILVTGAGAVLKQVLSDSGIGEVLARFMAQYEVSLIVFGFLSAALVRILQGSATVAMVTGASLLAVVCPDGLTSFQLSLLVVAIASGASIFSHVNDSGFWLVKQYLGLTEKQTFQSWTTMTTLFGFTGFMLSTICWIFVK